MQTRHLKHKYKNHGVVEVPSIKIYYHRRYLKIFQHFSTFASVNLCMEGETTDKRRQIDQTLFDIAAKAVTKKRSRQALHRTEHFFPTRSYFYEERQRYFEELSGTICRRARINEKLNMDYANYAKVALFKELKYLRFS